FENMNLENTLKLFRILPKEDAAEIFAYMDSETKQQVIEAMTDNELRSVIDELYMDDTVDLIEEMPASVVKRVLLASSLTDRKLINQLLNYPDDCAGSLMTTEFVDLKRTITVSKAFEHIRKTGIDKETIYTIYVTDENRKLEGVLTAKELLLADPDDIIEEIMEENVIFARTLDDQEKIANLFQKYDMIALPVVDKENRLVGIVTIDDAVDVMQEENTEDFQKMAAIQPTEETYFKTSVFTHARKRIIWLLVLMLSAMFTGLIISHYQNAFANIPLLVSFIPMLMSTGGNCGSQSATMIIRGFALGEIEIKDFLKVWFKEIRISLIVGIILVAVNFIRIFLQYNDFFLALTIGISLMFIIVFAKSLGCLLPMIAKLFKLDPAIMAAPLISTISDAFSVFVFFNMSLLILNLTP
ncbi:MAG: magnesium transporter, partial [Oscillospiraceae bacterium]